MLNAEWHKPSKSGPYTDNCVEARLVGETVEVRSTRDRSGSTLRFDLAEWRTFLDSVPTGEFNV
jgi:Domain of unknown function (DUF397)